MIEDINNKNQCISELNKVNLKENVEHWEYEMNTRYSQLPDNIQESDRKKEKTNCGKI